MTATIPISKIEKTVYKNFVSLKNVSSIKLSEFLSKLEIGHIIPDEEMIRFSKLSLIRALIYKQLKGIKSSKNLSDYLKSNENDALNLGFDKDETNTLMVPDQRSFSYFLVHKLIQEEKEIIELIVKKIREISEKFDLSFDTEIPKIEEKIEPVKETNVQYQKEQKLSELSKRLRQIIYPKIKLDIKHNAKYTKNTILDVLVHSALEGSFTNGGALSYKKNGSISPASNTILYHLKKHDPKSTKAIFTKVSDELFRIAKRSGKFNKRKFDVAVDYTFQHYYGDPNHPNIVNSKYDHGTIRYFKYITLDIVENGTRFTLCAFPVFIFDREADLVKELLEYTQKKIKINKIYMDRGFANEKIFNLLQSMKLNYVVPLPDDRGVKKVIETVSPPFVIHNYKRGNAIIKNLVLVEGTKGLMKIATNIPINSHDVDLIENLPRMYGKRWGIETGYRVKKREGLVKTTSNNYSIRLFYFLFSVALYNLWTLINLLVMLELGIKDAAKRVVTFKLFLKSLYEIVHT